MRLGHIALIGIPHSFIRRAELLQSRVTGNMLKRLLVAVDGSENATRAAKAAVRLAKEFEAEVE